MKKHGGQKKMKTTRKKLIGGLLIGLLVATVGAAFANGQTDDITDESTNNEPPQMSFGGRHGMIGLGNTTTSEPSQMPFGYMIGPYASELTEEQQIELEELLTSLREQNASFDEIRAEIQGKLDEFGVFDIQLDNEIAQTEQMLTLLNRQKELRNEGYSWDEINSIIEEEFGENATGFSWNMMDGSRCGHGPHGGPRDLIAGEDLEQ